MVRYFVSLRPQSNLHCCGPHSDGSFHGSGNGRGTRVSCGYVSGFWLLVVEVVGVSLFQPFGSSTTFPIVPMI